MPDALNETNQKMWENVRRVIEHHDTIVSQRLTWYLVINGFLFAACAAIVGQIEKADSFYRFLLWSWLAAITFCAFVLSHIAFNLLRVPTYNLYEVRKKWWVQYCKRNNIGPGDFPPVSGWKSGYNKLWFHNLTTIPRVLKYAWLISNAALAYTAGYWYAHDNPEANAILAVCVGVVYVVCLVLGVCYTEWNATINLGTLTDDDS